MTGLNQRVDPRAARSSESAIISAEDRPYMSSVVSHVLDPPVWGCADVAHRQRAGGGHRYSHMGSPCAAAPGLWNWFHTALALCVGV